MVSRHANLIRPEKTRVILLRNILDVLPKYELSLVRPSSSTEWPPKIDTSGRKNNKP